MPQESIGERMARRTCNEASAAYEGACAVYRAFDNDFPNAGDCFVVRRSDDGLVLSAVYLDEADCLVSVGDRPGRFLLSEPSRSYDLSREGV